MDKTTHNWTIIDRWDLGDEANCPELMIVTDGTDHYLLGKLREHPALPATWCMAIRILKTDTRETLEADAGRNCPMTVWDCAMEGYDDDRPIMFEWSDSIIHNIANAAK